ncbi:hypothetical protein LTR27_001410 [Elasticomyces elasticus]|nr:hypothetical protein LTR27_001410 [Elasticomyces elasticus]
MDGPAWEQLCERREAKRAAFNTYWTLDPYNNINMIQLKERLATLDERTTNIKFCRRTLEIYMQRIDRDLLRYDLYEADELLDFAAARRITVRDYVTEDTKPATLRRNHAILVEQLWHADDNATFPFEKLLPELRVKVYDMYIDGFSKTLTTPAQPPLARTCRLMRSEILPIFYRRTRFTLTLEANLKSLRFGKDSTIFIETLAPEHLATIREIRFEIIPAAASGCGEVLTLRGNGISLVGSGKHPTKIIIAKCKLSSRFEGWKQRVINEIRKVVMKMERKDERPVLRTRDLYALRSALEAIWH